MRLLRLLPVSILLRDHPYITSVKDWVGGFRKLPILPTFSTVCIYNVLIPEVVGVVRKPQNIADVIHGWSPKTSLF